MASSFKADQDLHRVIIPKPVKDGMSYTCLCGHTQTFTGPRPFIGVWTQVHLADVAMAWQRDRNPDVEWIFHG